MLCLDNYIVALFLIDFAEYAAGPGVSCICLCINSQAKCYYNTATAKSEKPGGSQELFGIYYH